MGINIWDEIHALLGRYDGDISIECGSESMWGGQLRFTLTNPDDGPSRSITFYSVAGADPTAVATRLVADAQDWLSSTDTEPLPVPDWKLDD